MKKRRGFFDGCKNEKELCGGPGKLTQAFAITGSHHGINLLHDPDWSPVIAEKTFRPPRLLLLG